MGWLASKVNLNAMDVALWGFFVDEAQFLYTLGAVATGLHRQSKAAGMRRGSLSVQ